MVDERIDHENDKIPVNLTGFFVKIGNNSEASCRR